MEQGQQCAEEEGGGEQEGAHARAELLRGAAAGPFAVGSEGEDVSAPGGRGDGDGEAEQRGRVAAPPPVRAAGHDLVEQALAVHGVAQEPAGVQTCAARSAGGAQGSVRQAGAQGQAGQQGADDGDESPRPVAEDAFGDPEPPAVARQAAPGSSASRVQAARVAVSGSAPDGSTARSRGSR